MINSFCLFCRVCLCLPSTRSITRSRPAVLVLWKYNTYILLQSAPTRPPAPLPLALCPPPPSFFPSPPRPCLRSPIPAHPRCPVLIQPLPPPPHEPTRTPAPPSSPHHSTHALPRSRSKRGEIFNAYMHCYGCETILQKDLTLCLGCHAAGKYGFPAVAPGTRLTTDLYHCPGIR